MNTLATMSVLDNQNMPGFQFSPRLLNRKLNIVHHAISVVEKQNKGRVTSKAIAEYLGLSVDECSRILQDANNYRLFHHSQEAA